MIYLFSTLILIILGFVFGRLAESRHYHSIAQREAALVNLPNTAGRQLIIPMQHIEKAELVTGNVVISIDYFKRIVAGLRSLIGGPLQSYETLLDRARREAILRMKESCPGASQIINIRIETCAIHGRQPGSIGSVELIAYGTAIYGSPL